MNIDFMHNQIIRDTITPVFIENFNENLMPYLIAEYGSSLEAVQFYEDHLADGFRIGGEFHYPLTVVVNGAASVRWIKWQVSNYRSYDKFNPFSYKGQQPLEFELLDEPPAELVAQIAGKPIYADDSAVRVLVTSAAEDKTFLAGKYSQGFVDELARSVTELIERELGVMGLSESGVVLELHFAPGTFREYTSGSTTYRRLLIKARGCVARDLWVKWCRLDGRGVYTTADNVLSDDVSFSLAEDVPGKIKEQEYRYLTADSVEKYQAAMGRKNITAWREMMRRVIRRGEVELCEREEETVTEAMGQLLDELTQAPEEKLEEKPQSAPTANMDSSAALRSMLEGLDDEPEADEDEEDEATRALRSVMTSAYESNDTADGEQADATDFEQAEDGESEAADEEPFAEEQEVTVVSTSSSEDSIRAELERKIRAEYAERMEAQERETAALKAKLEAQIRTENRERQLMAEAARAALIEQERLAREREEKAALELAAEKARAEQEQREAAERAERERIEAEARLAEEAKRKEQERLDAEAAAVAKAAEAAVQKTKVRYVSRSAKLLFRNNVDPTITQRIYDKIVSTIRYYHKEDVYIKIKATVPDTTTVNLEFVKIPDNEEELLVNIINVLGRSDLGIIKAILD